MKNTCSIKNGFCQELGSYVMAVYCQKLCEKNQYPGMATMAKSFTKAAVKHVASGFKTRTKTEIRSIIEICTNCTDYVGGRCKKCGCNMKKKIQWSTTHCPIKKW